MNCPKCGSPVGKNDEYCGSCGYHLNTSGEEKPKKKKSSVNLSKMECRWNIYQKDNLFRLKN